MNSTITDAISEIRRRFKEAKSTLDLERNKNAELSAKISELNTLREGDSSKIKSLEINVSELEQSIERLKAINEEKVALSSSEKDKEIDALVHEIDRCINQIKTNNE